MTKINAEGYDVGGGGVGADDLGASGNGLIGLLGPSTLAFFGEAAAGISLAAFRDFGLSASQRRVRGIVLGSIGSPCASQRDVASRLAIYALQCKQGALDRSVRYDSTPRNARDSLRVHQ